jgi:CBS domain-containing protein
MPERRVAVYGKGYVAGEYNRSPGQLTQINAKNQGGYIDKQYLTSALHRMTYYAEDPIVPINAADIMTRQLITARPDSTVAEVARLLNEHDISALPICDNDGTLLGMISESDLMSPFRQEHALRRAWWLGILSFGEVLARALTDYVHEDRRRAGELMIYPVITASETATPVEIADLLLRYHIKRVPIMRGQRLLGIVSRADLIRTLVLCPVTFSDCAWQPSTVGSDKPAAMPHPAAGSEASPC